MPKKTPRYQELATILRNRLTDGEFPLGTRFPTIDALMEQYDVTAGITVRQAIAILADEGLLEPRHGSGTYVRALPVTDRGRAALRADLLNLQTALDSAQSALTRVLRHLDDTEPTD